MDPHPSRPADDPAPLALVMGGGGARAAYQVGFLRVLARRFPELDPPILTGVSAGAINAVHLASHPGTFLEAVEDLTRLWRALDMERVFRVDARSLTLNALRWALQLASGGMFGTPRIRGLVDTEPLRRFLQGALGVEHGPIGGIRAKLEAGRLRAVAVSTSSYTTGRSVTWIQGRGVEGWLRPRRQAILTDLTLDHVMASTALPIFFPAQRIDREWYGDGGVRLSAPLSPAVHLGAHRLLAISTRFEPTYREALQPVTPGYPPPAQVIGTMLNAIFLDLMDQDAWRVERLNTLLERLPEDQRDGLRVIRLLTLRPSRDLGRLANEYEIRLPPVFRFMVRGLGTRQTESPDLLSFLLFDPGYIEGLIEMGEKDAYARIGEIETILEPPAAERASEPGVEKEDEPGERPDEGDGPNGRSNS